MKNKDFCHLHVHNEYSLLDGYGDAKQYISRVKEMGFRYIALTNHGNIDGCLKWQDECDKQGIRPVLGSELYICQNTKVKSKAVGHIVILVKNELGWVELCKLITRAHIEGYHKRPRADYEMILGCDMSGWVVMTACIGSFLNLDGGVELAKEIKDRTDLYFEIMPPNMASQLKYHAKWSALDFVGELPLVATVDCHYPNADDVNIQDVLLAIQRNKKWSDSDRWSFDFRELYLQSAAEIYNSFRDNGQFTIEEIKSAMANTIKIARKCCQFRIKKKTPHLPIPLKYKSDYDKQPTQEYADAYISQTLDDLINEGLRVRGFDDNKTYIERVDREIKTIASKGFELYFLVVKDVVDWCKENDIMVGPGRGSVGGCLIAYLLGITEIDPIKYKLPFSRFIKEDRIDLPDIDVDFERMKRPEVIQYLREKYGRYNTASISTFGVLHARGCIREIGRVFELPYTDIDKFAKSVPYIGTDEDTIPNALKDSKSEASRFQSLYPKETDDILKLSGQIKNRGQHAAAIVVSNDDLRNGERCTLLLNKDGEPIINWDMNDAEFNGLLKIDILGLSTLSILNYARELINKSQEDIPSFWYHPESECYFADRDVFSERVSEVQLDNIDFNYDKINLDDKDVFNLINSGKTAGIFQIQSWATTNLCQDIEIESFEDICAAVALVRPGATKSGMTEKYIERKHGKEWAKKHPIYEELTKDTYGILAYQEQVMQVISRIAGLSETHADNIRKIIAKKHDTNAFSKHKKDFMEGCNRTKNFNRDEAEEFWRGLLEWGAYGFNRAHSVAYALIGYWTAWIKYYYPKQFYCASLTYGDDDDDYHKSKQRLIDEILQSGWKILPPKVCLSDALKWTFNGDTFYTPFTELKGVAEANAIKCADRKQKKACRGLFNVKVEVQNQTKLDKTLSSIRAWDEEVIPDDIDDYLEFNMLDSVKDTYTNLVKLLGYDTNTGSIEAAKSLTMRHRLNFFPYEIIKRKRWHVNEVVECELCDLANECLSPIVTSKGVYNVFINAEAPGRDEDTERKNLVGRAGQLLWDEIARYGYTRRHFHISNTNRCYPKKTKTPTKEQVDTCFPWTIRELKETECRLVLGIGNNTLFAITGRDKGIMKLSGETEWIEELGLWVCWCIHPSAVLRQQSNREYFEKGIKNFIEKFELLR